MDYDNKKSFPDTPETLVWKGRDENTGFMKRTRVSTDGLSGETIIWDGTGGVKSHETIKKNENGSIRFRMVSGYSQWNKLYD